MQTARRCSTRSLPCSKSLVVKDDSMTLSRHGQIKLVQDVIVDMGQAEYQDCKQAWRRGPRSGRSGEKMIQWSRALLQSFRALPVMPPLSGASLQLKYASLSKIQAGQLYGWPWAALLESGHGCVLCTPLEAEDATATAFHWAS